MVEAQGSSHVPDSSSAVLVFAEHTKVSLADRSCMIKRVETYHIAPAFVEGPDSLVQLLYRHRHLDWGA